MKLMYTHENRLLVSHVKNILENDGISTVLKNEYAAGAVGDLSPFDTWLELWLIDDSDDEKAVGIIREYQKNCEMSDTDSNAKDWCCQYCQESNDPSFDLCWHCQKEPAR